MIATLCKLCATKRPMPYDGDGLCYKCWNRTIGREKFDAQKLLNDWFIALELERQAGSEPADRSPTFLTDMALIWARLTNDSICAAAESPPLDAMHTQVFEAIERAAARAAIDPNDLPYVDLESYWKDGAFAR